MIYLSESPGGKTLRIAFPFDEEVTLFQGDVTFHHSEVQCSHSNDHPLPSFVVSST